MAQLEKELENVEKRYKDQKKKNQESETDLRKDYTRIMNMWVSSTSSYDETLHAFEKDNKKDQEILDEAIQEVTQLKQEFENLIEEKKKRDERNAFEQKKKDENEATLKKLVQASEYI